MRSRPNRIRTLGRTVAAALLLDAALLAGCVSHRDDYGGSNDVGYKPMYGAYNGSFDGTVNSGWGYAGMAGYGPVGLPY